MHSFHCEPCPYVVSAIIPARNEELNIGGAVRSLASQSEIGEIIVIDDQSVDGTASILARLAGEYPMLRVARIETLPAGWLGKPHALSEGAKRASGDWLLFTDADTRHKPESLRALLKRAESAGADMISVSPGQRLETFWEKAVIPLVYLRLARLFPFEDAAGRQSTSAANGQYILVRRSTYDSSGGWEAVRGEVLDDVAFARRVKSAGGKILFLPGAQWVETRMYRSLGELWRGWTKNLFLLYGRDSGKILRAVLRLFCIEAMPGALCLAFCGMVLAGGGHVPGWTAVGGALCLVAILAQQWVQKRELRRVGFSPGLSKYVLAGAPLFGLILLNSLWVYWRGGSIEWKGRYYPVKRIP